MMVNQTALEIRTLEFYGQNGKWDDGDAEMPFIVEIPQGPPGMPVEVTACHPFHIDYGYDQNFFGVEL